MLTIEQVILLIILGIVAAIVYSLRVLVLMERRISRIDENLERIALQIVEEEKKIKEEEDEIEKVLNIKKGKSKKP